MGPRPGPEGRVPPKPGGVDPACKEKSPRWLVRWRCWRARMQQPHLESPKRVGCVAKVASGALLGSSWALLRSEEHFGCVLGSIWGPSGPQNQCSRRGESIDSRKSAFPRSTLILVSKSPLKLTIWTPQWRSRRVQSASRAPPHALQDAFWPSLGSLGARLGAFGPFSRAQGRPGRTPAPLRELFLKHLR